MKGLRLEILKGKGRGIWLIALAMLAVELIWMLWAFRNPDEKDMKWGWMMLLYNLPLLRAIIFPTIAGVMASKQADLEHKSGALRVLETMQSTRSIYSAKLLYGGIAVTTLTLLELLCMVAMGKLYGFAGEPEPWAFGLTLLFNLATGLEVYAIALALSMSIKNQAIPLSVSCAGSFIGLVFMFLPQLPTLRMLIPWAQVGALMFTGMDWTKADGMRGMYYMDIDWRVFALALIYLVAAVFIGRRAFARGEV